MVYLSCPKCQRPLEGNRNTGPEIVCPCCDTVVPIPAARPWRAPWGVVAVSLLQFPPPLLAFWEFKQWMLGPVIAWIVIVFLSVWLLLGLMAAIGIFQARRFGRRLALILALVVAVLMGLLMPFLSVFGVFMGMGVAFIPIKSWLIAGMAVLSLFLLYLPEVRGWCNEE